MMSGAALLTLAACGGGGTAPSGPPGAAETPAATADEGATPHVALFTEADLKLGAIDPVMSEKGKTTYDVKCQACHSTGPNRIVGPGWEGLTSKRKPEWIMNMILNVEVMLDQDPEAQKLLELCLTRMPNQNVSIGDARDILEFMRQNDGEK